MSYAVQVRLPDDLRKPLQQMADAAGQTPEELVTAIVQQQLTHRDMRLRRHFGSVNLGAPTGADNVEIDADLALVYAD